MTLSHSKGLLDISQLVKLWTDQLLDRSTDAIIYSVRPENSTSAYKA